MHNQTQFKRVTSQLDQTSSRTFLLIIGAALGKVGRLIGVLIMISIYGQF